MKALKNSVTTFFVLLLSLIPAILFCFSVFYEWGIIPNIVFGIFLYIGFMLQVYIVFPAIERVE